MKKNCKVRLLLWLLLCSAPIVSAAQPATRIQAKYEVLKGGVKVATINEIYSRTLDGYTLESNWKAVGMLAFFKPETIQVTSAGKVTEQGLRPLTYIHNRKIDTKRNARADLDWDANRITLTDRAGVRTLPLPAGTQDRLSAMYQFLFVPLQNAASYDLNMTNGSKISIYNFQLTPNQSVTVPLGTFKALYVASPKIAKENRTEIWLAVEHAYFPYKMVITEADGGTLTQVLTSIKFEP